MDKNNIFSALRSLYNSIPDTKGCMENLEKCKGWCCKLNSPQVLYCEFMYVWNYVIKDWDYDKIISLVGKCLKNYLSNAFNKPCVFFDEGKCLCEIHNKRNFNCRLFGITPEEEIKPRIERLRENFKSDILAEIKDQCLLVETIDCKKITKKDTDRWWKKLEEIEQDAGIDKKLITDAPGGTYRMYHDHVLIQLFPDDIMRQLSIFRTDGTTGEKEIFIENFLGIIKEEIRKIKND